MELGKYYTFNTKEHPEGTFIRKVGEAHMYVDNGHFDGKPYNNWKGGDTPQNVREASLEQIMWLDACIEAQKFVPKPIILYQIY